MRRVPGESRAVSLGTHLGWQAEVRAALCQKDSLGGLGTCSREPRAEDGCMRCLGAGLAVHAGASGGNVVGGRLGWHPGFARGQMSSQVQVQVLSSVCHPDRQELSHNFISNVWLPLEFEGTFVLFHPKYGVDVLEDATILQSLSESKKWLLTCLKEVHPP